jgi:hypothetical protein
MTHCNRQQARLQEQSTLKLTIKPSSTCTSYGLPMLPAMMM